MKVSIITPIYKGESYIYGLLKMAYKNLKSIKESGFMDELEYIFVNDSPEYKKLDQNKIQKAADVITSENDKKTYKISLNVKVINNDKNCGINRSRCAGLEASDGEYVIFLDQDDMLKKDAVAQFIRELRKYSDLSDGGALQNDEQDDKPDVIVANGYKRNIKLVPIYLRKSILNNIDNKKLYIYGTDIIFSPGQCMIKKSSIPLEWNEKPLDVNGCDDFYLWLLMFNKNCRFVGMNKKIYYHNEHENNYSGSYDNMEKSFMAMCNLLEECREYPKKNIEVLRRRYKLKSTMKKSKSGIKKLKEIMCNLDVFVYTVAYKFMGYK